jgi:hypothetical protein
MKNSFKLADKNHMYELNGNDSKKLNKSIRIKKETNDKLLKIIEETNISFNSLVNNILEYHLQSSLPCKEIDYVAFAKDTFKAMLDGLDDEFLLKIARKTGSFIIKDTMTRQMFPHTLQGLLMNLNTTGKFYNWGIITTEVTQITVLIRWSHNLGLRWSNFIKEYFLSCITDMGILPEKVTITEMSTVFTFVKDF